MPDSRFYQDLGPANLGELASLAGADLSDPSSSERPITGVAPLGP
jgi:hypothetical protein